MKTKLFAFLLFASVICFSCEDDESDEFCSNPEAECPDGEAIDVNACCTDESCYWTYAGTDYDCNGTNCDAVYDIIITNACASGSITSLKASDTKFDELRDKLEATTQKLLAEARAASGCN